MAGQGLASDVQGTCRVQNQPCTCSGLGRQGTCRVCRVCRVVYARGRVFFARTYDQVNKTVNLFFPA